MIALVFRLLRASKPGGPLKATPWTRREPSTAGCCKAEWDAVLVLCEWRAQLKRHQRRHYSTGQCATDDWYGRGPVLSGWVRGRGVDFQPQLERSGNPSHIQCGVRRQMSHPRTSH